MPMLNLRHQIKCGRRERRTGAITSDVNRCFLPNIVKQAPVYHEYGLARELSRDQSVPDPAFAKLPHLPTAPAAAKPNISRPAHRRVNKPTDDLPRCTADRNPKGACEKQEKSSKSSRTDQSYPYDALKNQSYEPKPPAGGKPTKTNATSGHVKLPAISVASATELKPKKSEKRSRIPVLVRDGNTWLKKVTKPSRIPVLVRDGNTSSFNNPPKRGPATTKVMAIVKPTQRVNGRGHGVASDDMGKNLPANSNIKQNARRCGSNHRSSDASDIVTPSCDAGSADPWDMEHMDETRRQRIEKYAKIFDELVRATAEAIAQEQQEAIDAIAMEKNDAIDQAVKAVVEETFA